MQEQTTNHLHVDNPNDMSEIASSGILLHSHKTYDVVFIGQYASIVASMFCKFTDNQYKCLCLLPGNTVKPSSKKTKRQGSILYQSRMATMQAFSKSIKSMVGSDQNKDSKKLGLSEQSIVEPSLLPLFTEQIRVHKQPYSAAPGPQKEHVSNRLRVKQVRVNQINPVSKQIYAQGNQAYEYKFLVFSGQQEDWLHMDRVRTLQEALSNEYSLVFSNHFKRDLSSIYSKYDSGNVLFYVPNGRHSGYDNYAFLVVHARFRELLGWAKQNRKFKKMKASQSPSRSSLTSGLHFKIILEGTSFFPYCKEADTALKKQLLQYPEQIEIIYNSRVSGINYLRRTVTVNESYDLTYNTFYCHLPQHCPDLLRDSGIDPYENNARTLWNKGYKNVFVFGADIFPTTHTFKAIQQQAHVICQNLHHLLSKSGEVALYDGETHIPLHFSDNQIVQVCHFYSKDRSPVSSQHNGVGNSYNALSGSSPQIKILHAKQIPESGRSNIKNNLEMAQRQSDHLPPNFSHKLATSVINRTDPIPQCKHPKRIKHHRSTQKSCLNAAQSSSVISESTASSTDTEIKESCTVLTYFVQKLTRRYLVDSYFNYKLSGGPYYLFSPILKTVKVGQTNHHRQQHQDTSAPQVGQKGLCADNNKQFHKEDAHCKQKNRKKEEMLDYLVEKSKTKQNKSAD